MTTPSHHRRHHRLRVFRHLRFRPPRPRGWLALFGPGLITGASDDDPSGIATYSQAGARFGFAMCWVMLFTFPLMAAIQEISARIGRVTGHGIAGNIRQFYPAWLSRVIVGLLLIANIINLGADLGAMGDVLRLVIGGPAGIYVVIFATACAVLEIFSRYKDYANFLKWSSIALLAYVVTALVVPINWADVAWNTFIPNFSIQTDYVVAIVAVLGTTITPYCFFWQSSEEAEDQRVNPDALPLLDDPGQAPAELRRMRIDTYVGMGYSNLISWFIIVTTAATLHLHGVTNVETSEQAAEALRPIAGPFAFFAFAFGIIGIGMLAVPVLAASSAYALGEALRWTTGLGREPKDAQAFYGAIAAATLIGIGFNFVSIDPIKALFWCAVINGVVAIPLMVVMMIMASDPRVMGPFVLPGVLRTMGWLCTSAMAVAVAIMFATWGS
jgi:Mn2+/Fe2+ NRAMP family transporter